MFAILDTHFTNKYNKYIKNIIKKSANKQKNAYAIICSLLYAI